MRVEPKMFLLSFLAFLVVTTAVPGKTDAEELNAWVYGQEIYPGVWEYTVYNYHSGLVIAGLDLSKITGTARIRQTPQGWREAQSDWSNMGWVAEPGWGKEVPEGASLGGFQIESQCTNSGEIDSFVTGLWRDKFGNDQPGYARKVKTVGPVC
jgi:hypothetical protein